MLATTTLATLPEWIVAAVAVLAAWRISRGGGGSAVHELSEANRVLEQRLHTLGAEVRDLRIENAELRGRTDIEAVMTRHEERAMQRHEAMLNVLALIAGRLGPEPHA